MEGISVVIPCFNEEKYIAICLEGIINNGFSSGRLEILVVDGGSTDNTLKILDAYCQKYGFIKVINNLKQKTPFALNLGIHHAKYSYVLIAGAHAEYPINYLKQLFEYIQTDSIDVIGGAIQTKTKNSSDKTKAICYVLSHPFGVGNSIFRTGAERLMEVDTVPFGLYTKSIFEQVGLYNEKLIRNHDMELSRRIKASGKRIWLDPKLKCTYYARETFKEIWKNNYANGFWNIKTVAITHKFSSLSLRHFIPLIFVLSLIIPLIGALLINAWVLSFSIVSLIAYTALILKFSFIKNIKMRYIITTFFVLHFSYGMGSLIGIFNLLSNKHK